MSRRQLDSELRRRYLSPVRMREWAAIYRELRQEAIQQGLKINAQPASPDALHRAILTGFLDRIARLHPEPEKANAGPYRTARGRRVTIFPGSGLSKRRPEWIVAAELIETSRPYAHHVAEIEPEWLEEAAPHLLRRHVDAPTFDPDTGRVTGKEQLSLFNLVFVPSRAVDYARVDRISARDIFIREGLVEDGWSTKSVGVNANRQRLEKLRKLEARGRRRDLVADTDELAAFYQDRLPSKVVDGRSFEVWCRQEEALDPSILRAPPELLQAQAPSGVDETAFPLHGRLGSLEVPFIYRFEPGTEDDGVTARIPLSGLLQADPISAEWLVPGLLQEKILAMIRILPKPLRRHFVPAPDYARALHERLGQEPVGELPDRMARALKQMSGIDVHSEDFRWSLLPRHLRMRFAVYDDDGQPLAASRDLRNLQERFGRDARARFRSRSPRDGVERHALEVWDVGDLSEPVSLDDRAGLLGYRALVKEEREVALRLFPDADSAAAEHRQGVLALLRHRFRHSVRELGRSANGVDALALASAGRLSRSACLDDLIDAVFAEVVLTPDAPWTQYEFETRCQRLEERLVPRARALDEVAGLIATHYRDLRQRLQSRYPDAWKPAFIEIGQQLDALIFPGFLQETPVAYRGRLPTYLKAMLIRLDRLGRDPLRDARIRSELAPLAAKMQSITGEMGTVFRYRLEELRVQRYAQELGTVEKVSIKRLEKAIAEYLAL